MIFPEKSYSKFMVREVVVDGSSSEECKEKGEEWRKNLKEKWNMLAGF